MTGIARPLTPAGSGTITRHDIRARKMSEWRRGWRIVLGAGLAAGTGVNLLYYVFSIFIPALQKETGWTLGQFSTLQALIGLGSLAAPAVGYAMDRVGLRAIYALGMALLALLFVVIAALPLAPWLFGAIVFATGLIGVATTSIAYTRAVNGWFVASRGFALAVAATGLSLSAVAMPPVFEWIVSTYGWRAGYLLLAALAGGIGLPAILVLLKDPKTEPGKAATRHAPDDTGFVSSPPFWLMCGAMVAINLPGSGMLSQMVPMLVGEGLTARTAALGISAFAAGQFVGRLACGWLLDRANPLRVAFAFTLVPSFGCLALFGLQHSAIAALLGVAAIGVQQGAEIDLLGYLVARRFGLDRYSTIYGWVQTAGWTGTLCGILAFGRMHDWTGSFALFQLCAAASYAIAATLFLFVRLPRLEARGPHGSVPA